MIKNIFNFNNQPLKLIEAKQHQNDHQHRPHHPHSFLPTFVQLYLGPSSSQASQKLRIKQNQPYWRANNLILRVLGCNQIEDFNLDIIIFLMPGGKGLINEEHLDIPRFKIEPVERGFVQHKKCLKLCLKIFDTNSLSQPQKQCIASCLGKFKESQRYLVEKMHQLIHAQAMASADIKALYDGVGEQAQNIVGDKF